MSAKNKTDLSTYNNDWYNPGNPIKRGLWYFTNVFIMRNRYNPFSGLRVLFLKMYGAKVGKGVNIKPGVNIKYPWKLTIGNHVWIGEGVWIDNLGQVTIGDSACLSQECMLLCGNHNFKKSAFDLMVKDIIIEEGAWVGAKAVVTPGVTCHSHSILTVGSIATHNLEPYSIYQGNPAQKIKERSITS